MKTYFAVLVALAAGSFAFGVEKFEVNKDFFLVYSVTNNEAKIIKCSSKEDSSKKENALFPIKIPSKIENASVVEIDDGAFADLRGLAKISIPNSVKIIGEGAFSNCTSLVSLEIPNSVTNIGDFAFMRCRSIEYLELPKNLAVIPTGCFSDCRSISKLKLPEQLVEIGELAFWDCGNISKITIPASVTNIGGRAFFDCNKLKEAEFTGEQPFVGERAFDGVHPSFGFRAPKDMWQEVEMPGTFDGHPINDRKIEAYRKLIFLPFVIGAIGTIVIMLVAIMLRDRSKDDEEESEEI